MKVGFIGAGKVGFSLGKWMSEGGVHVTGYYSRHIESADRAAEFTDSVCFDELKLLVEQSDAIMITVPDGEISHVYEQMAECDLTEKQICHCSGAMTASECFKDIGSREAYGYSIHPLFPVSSKYESYKDLTGAFFCIEGSKKHLDDWKKLLLGLGASVRIIEGDKVKYHAACAISSNLICSLVGESVRLLEECGFSRAEALEALRPLAITNLSKLLELGPARALTGPLERGDADTIRKHIECFDTDDEKDMYILTSRLLLREAKEKNPERNYTLIEDILKG